MSGQRGSVRKDGEGVASRARLLRVGVSVLRRLPRGCDRLLWSAGGFLSYCTAGQQRSIVRENQRLALRARPGSEGISRWRLEWSTCRAYYFYARYWVEILRLGSLAIPEVVMRVDAVDAEQFVARRLARQPTIVVLAHTGNWEWGGAWASITCNGVTAVAESLGDPMMTQWFLETRRRLGIKIILTGGDVALSLLRSLRDGELVALLADRDISGTGEVVKFLGENIALASGPGVLSVMSGAPIFPVGTYQRRGGRHEVRFFPPIEPPTQGARAERVAQVMRQVAAAVETIVVAEPHQWHNFQRYDESPDRGTP